MTASTLVLISAEEGAFCKCHVMNRHTTESTIWRQDNKETV